MTLSLLHGAVLGQYHEMIAWRVPRYEEKDKNANFQIVTLLIFQVLSDCHWGESQLAYCLYFANINQIKALASTVPFTRKIDRMRISFTYCNPRSLFVLLHSA
jgi:hypothetical protein